MSGQQLADQAGDNDTRLELRGSGLMSMRAGSLPTHINGPPGGRRWSVDAAGGGADGARRGARLRCV